MSQKTLPMNGSSNAAGPPQFQKSHRALVTGVLIGVKTYTITLCGAKGENPFA
jgi:hypothetical protein